MVSSLELFWFLITYAPAFSASDTVLSFDPSSYTMTWSTNFVTSLIVFLILYSSLYAGMQASVNKYL